MSPFWFWFLMSLFLNTEYVIVVISGVNSFWIFIIAPPNSPCFPQLFFWKIDESIVKNPWWLYIAPPRVAWLLMNVELVIVTFPASLCRNPPWLSAMLFLNTEFSTFKVPRLLNTTPPYPFTSQFENVEFFIVVCPLL